MEARLFRQGVELRLDYYQNAFWSWVMTGYQGDALNAVETLSRVGVGGIAFGLGKIEQPRRIVITLDVQGKNYSQLHNAIAELESYLRWRNGSLELHMRRDASVPWNSINVICEQFDVQTSVDEQFRAQVTIRFAATRLYWREETGITFNITNPPITNVRAVVVDLSTMTFAPIVGIDEPIRQIDYRQQSDEWILFGSTKVFRAPRAGGGVAGIGQAPAGTTTLRGCVDHNGNIMCVAQGINQLLRFTYPASYPTVLGTFNGTPVRVRRFGTSYISVGEFSQYGTLTGLAGVVATDVNGGSPAAPLLFSTNDIFPGGGRVNDVLWRDGVFVGIAHRAPSPSQSWISVASAQVPYYYVASGASSWAPIEIDQSSTIDEVLIAATSAIHAGRTFGALCTLRDLASVVPVSYPTASIGGVNDGVAVERYTFSTTEPRKIYRVKDGVAMPLFVASQNMLAVHRVAAQVCIGFSNPATVIPPLALNVSTIANTGTTAEIVPRFNLFNDERCWGMYSRCDYELFAEIFDPSWTPFPTYEARYEASPVRILLPGTRYDKLFRGSVGGNVERYWFTVNKQINTNVSLIRYKHDWR